MALYILCTDATIIGINSHGKKERTGEQCVKPSYRMEAGSAKGGTPLQTMAVHHFLYLP